MSELLSAAAAAGAAFPSLSKQPSTRWSQTLPPCMFTARVATDLLIHDSKVFIPRFPCTSTEYTKRSFQELVDPGASDHFHSLLFSWKDAPAASVGAGHEKNIFFPPLRLIKTRTGTAGVFCFDFLFFQQEIKPRFMFTCLNVACRIKDMTCWK